MKKNYSIFSIVFAVFHLALLCAILFNLIAGRISISTDFIEMMPSNGISEGVAEAERAFASKQNGTVNLFFESSSFDEARSAAVSFYEAFNGSEVFDAINLNSMDFNLSDLTGLLQEHKYQLLDEETLDYISSDPESFQQDSLASVFSAFTLSSLDNLESDPFLIEEIILRDYLEKAGSLSPFSPVDGVLAAQVDGMWYVLVQGTLSAKALDISRTDGGIQDIYDLGDSLEAGSDTLKVYYSGLPFHSFESSSSAQREITVITIISLLLLFILFIVLLRSLFVVILFIISVLLSLFSAAAALTVCFSDIHIITLIFGTTLIGTSIDYAIHYYLAFADRRDNDNQAVVKGLRPNLTIGYGSTVLCYLLLLLSPYDILRQVAVFSAVGLTSSYLTVMGLFPMIMRRGMVSDKALFRKLPEYKRHRSYLPLLLVISIVLFVSQIPNFEIKNNIANLYDISDRMLRSEITAGKVMGYSSTSYCIVEGENEEEAREKEGLFTARLDSLMQEGRLNHYLSPSVFIPSVSQQQRSLDTVKTSLSPYLPLQCEALGLDEQVVYEEFNATPSAIGYDDIPASLFKSLSQLIPGEIGGKYYIVVMLLGSVDAEAVREAAAECEGVVFFQKSTDINRQLDMLTGSILRIFVIAFVIILLSMVVIFRKKGLFLAMSPLITFLCTMGLAPICGLSLDFFFSVGLLMVIGLGLDYMVFAGNSRKQPILAITLSYVTTALSFGSLFFSSFRPVHIFGLTVLIGVTAAYLTALLSGGGKEK